VEETSGSDDADIFRFVLAGGAVDVSVTLWVLTIAGLAARGAVMEQAAAWGVAVHALAGKALTLRYKGPGLLAREIAGEMPGILNTLEAKAGRG